MGLVAVVKSSSFSDIKSDKSITTKWVTTLKTNLLTSKKCSAFSTWAVKAKFPSPLSETASVLSALTQSTPKLTRLLETHPKKTWDPSLLPSKNTCQSTTKSRKTLNPPPLKTSLKV